MIYKIIWTLRAILYKLIFHSFGIPSYIGKPFFLKGTKNINIGRYVRIFPGLRMESHNKGKIIIHDNVGIGQNVHITCSDIPLIISSGCVILANSFITNIDHGFNLIDTCVLSQKITVRRTYLGENCFIGIGVAIQAGTVLGKQCIVGANSVVRGHFPDYCVLVGAPAKIIRRFNPDTQRWDRTNAIGEFIK